jgi:CheY-like chemotaxis protein
MHSNNKIHMLLIEDDLMAMYVTKRTLEDLGCKVTTTDNVANASKLLDSQKFDLILSDISLTDGEAFEILQSVRSKKDNINYNSPFVALTAHSEESYKAKAEEVGFLSLFQKPFSKQKADLLLKMYNSQVDPHDPQDQTISAIDWELAKIRAGREDIAVNVLHAAEAVLTGYRHALKEAYEEDDLDNARFIVNRIKGAISYCGLPRLEKAINSLMDELNKTDSLKTTMAFYDELIEEITRFLDEYKNFNDKMHPEDQEEKKH